MHADRLVAVAFAFIAGALLAHMCAAAGSSTAASCATDSSQAQPITSTNPIAEYDSHNPFKGIVEVSDLLPALCAVFLCWYLPRCCCCCVLAVAVAVWWLLLCAGSLVSLCLPVLLLLTVPHCYSLYCVGRCPGQATSLQAIRNRAYSGVPRSVSTLQGARADHPQGQVRQPICGPRGLEGYHLWAERGRWTQSVG